MIPKKIFQTWKSRNVSKEFQKLIDSWKLNNKNYDHVFFDDKECSAFLKKFDKKVYEIYEKIIPKAFKIDLWRLCVLYEYGGFYCDVDTLCLGSIDNFIDNNINFIIPIDLNSEVRYGNHNLFNSFMGSVSKNELLKNCIDRIIFNVDNNIECESPLDFSACGLVGRVVNKFLGRNETESFVGQEGICKGIHFLKFESDFEYIKDIKGNLLFQNKNGNSTIKKLYEKELEKASIKPWIKESSFVKKSIKHL